MNLQNSAILIFAILGGALPIALLLAPLVAAWRQLARIYPDQPCATERTFNSVSGQVGDTLGRVRRTLTLSVCPSGLRVVPWRVVWRVLPPFFLPWSEVSRCERARYYFSPEGLRFHMARWNQPIFFYGFLWRYGDALSFVESYCREHSAQIA